MTSAQDTPRVPVYGPVDRRGHTGRAAAPGAHTAAPGAHGGEPGTDLAHGLARLADLHEKIAAEFRHLAESPEIQLAAPPESRLMVSVDANSTAPKSVRFLTVKDLAGRLAVDAKTVRRWRSEGLLPPALDLGSVLRWREADIDAWIAERLEGSR